MNNNINQQLSALDILNILSFFIGLLNLEENLTQSDKQDLMKALDSKGNTLLNGINEHLESQDAKIDKILQRLGEKSNDNC